MVPQQVNYFDDQWSCLQKMCVQCINEQRLHNSHFFVYQTNSKAWKESVFKKSQFFVVEFQYTKQLRLHNSHSFVYQTNSKAWKESVFKKSQFFVVEFQYTKQLRLHNSHSFVYQTNSKAWKESVFKKITVLCCRISIHKTITFT